MIKSFCHFLVFKSLLLKFLEHVFFFAYKVMETTMNTAKSVTFQLHKWQILLLLLYTTIRKYIRIALTNFSFIQETIQWSFKFFIMYKYARIKGIKRVHHFLKCILVYSTSTGTCHLLHVSCASLLHIAFVTVHFKCIKLNIFSR